MSSPSENDEIAQIEEPKEEPVKMVQITLEISESFHNFLKEYLAFFGSGMTLEDLAQQMIYNESRHLHSALTEFVQDDTHYVGRATWFRKHRDVALTTGDWENIEGTTSYFLKSKENPEIIP